MEDVHEALENPPVKVLPVRYLEFDNHGESGQIRDLNLELGKFYYRRMKSEPPPISLLRAVAVSTGSM
jgi:hypothetical protein